MGKWIGLFFISFYQVYLRPMMGSGCRFTPTCSDYGAEAISKYGLLKGCVLTWKRLMRCRPGGSCGEDNVP